MAIMQSLDSLHEELLQDHQESDKIWEWIEKMQSIYRICESIISKDKIRQPLFKAIHSWKNNLPSIMVYCEKDPLFKNIIRLNQALIEKKLQDYFLYSIDINKL
jgi:hypothetical protein